MVEMTVNNDSYPNTNDDYHRRIRVGPAHSDDGPRLNIAVYAVPRPNTASSNVDSQHAGFNATPSDAVKIRDAIDEWLVSLGYVG